MSAATPYSIPMAMDELYDAQALANAAMVMAQEVNDASLWRVVKVLESQITEVINKLDRLDVGLSNKGEA
ncbi:MAG: hypothetical protein AB1899_16910 [Pseudomonadota bacterium]